LAMTKGGDEKHSGKRLTSIQYPIDHLSLNDPTSFLKRGNETLVLLPSVHRTEDKLRRSRGKRHFEFVRAGRYDRRLGCVGEMVDGMDDGR
jgi:hypothetical protein